MPMSSWGRLSKLDHDVVPLASRFSAACQLRNSPGRGIAYGMGRSYGDVCLNPGGTLWTTTSGLDHLIAFDSATGRLRCEGGVVLREIQTTFVRQGWSLPVTPGTELVTVGGAIANDVHGKNHHRMGTFGHHVAELQLLRTDGTVIRCSPTDHREHFEASIGGLGLTGVIVEAELQLRRVQGPWLEVESIPYGSLEEFFELADSSEKDWEYTVAWIDCMCAAANRGIFMRANHAADVKRPEPSERVRSVPVAPPFSLVNELSLHAFNRLYYALGKMKAGRSLAHFRKFFYPLDSLHNWNRMYGPRGFYQYQTVLPRHGGSAALKTLLKEVARSRTGSFLAVLKTFGEIDSIGMLSFARPGVTLALDFPNRGRKTLDLLDRLDRVVLEAKGRLYPAKDARMSKEMFHKGYPRADEFSRYRDPGIDSAMAMRLF